MFPIQTLARAGVALAASAALVGCSKSVDAEGDHDHEHGHAHDPKFGGELVEIGEHFANLEVVHDAETGGLTIYSLDAHAENMAKAPEESLAVSIHGDGMDPFDLTLASDVSELRKNALGSSSMFVAQSDALKGLAHFHGTVAAVTLRGKEFKDVEFMVGSHDGDGHDDDHDHDDGGDGDAGHGDEHGADGDGN